jgi:hypothetical protein
MGWRCGGGARSAEWTVWNKAKWMVLHRTPNTDASQIRLPAIGCCIYCFRKPPEVQLTDEHIIPDGLKGDIILLDASCCDCMKEIQKFEPLAINHLYRFPRGLLGIRSRKKRNRKPITFQYHPDSSGDIVEHAAAAGMPWAMGVPGLFDRPGILRGCPPQEVIPWTIHDFGELAGIDQYGEPSTLIHVGPFWRTLAKIAHGYAVSVIGLERFKPYLHNYIRESGECDQDGRFCDGSHLTYYIGNIDESHWHRTYSLHSLEITETTVQVYHKYLFFKRLAVVYIQLFSVYGFPVYEIVVGEFTGPALDQKIART